MAAHVEVLFNGYARSGTETRVASTVGLVIDGGQTMIVDPGMVPAQAVILDSLAARMIQPASISDVILSHHHPDHTMNTGLFPAARVHDNWATYQADVWTSRPAEGFHVSPSVTLLETPGHTPQDISTLVETADGYVVFTHLWWDVSGPPEDPRAQDPTALHQGRARVLALPGVRLVVPGHGAAFAPSAATPR